MTFFYTVETCIFLYHLNKVLCLDSLILCYVSILTQQDDTHSDFTYLWCQSWKCPNFPVVKLCISYGCGNESNETVVDLDSFCLETDL